MLLVLRSTCELVSAKIPSVEVDKQCLLSEFFNVCMVTFNGHFLRHFGTILMLNPTLYIC